VPVQEGRRERERERQRGNKNFHNIRKYINLTICNNKTKWKKEAGSCVFWECHFNHMGLLSLCWDWDSRPWDNVDRLVRNQGLMKIYMSQKVPLICRPGQDRDTCLLKKIKKVNFVVNYNYNFFFFFAVNLETTP
jgi:hypothetical protein